MKTVVIKMGELASDANGAKFYPVQLFFDDGQADWLTSPLGTSNIPENLSILNPPFDHVKKAAVEGKEIRDEFLKEVGASPRFEAWGSYLHQLLFQGEIAKEWNKLHDLYPQEAAGSEGLRTILDIEPGEKADELRWLPWELIYEAPMPRFFDSTNPFSRGTLDQPSRVKTFTWPIHALIVVGSKKNDSTVSAEQEIEAIQLAFIKSPVPIDWYISCRPTKEELHTLIKEFKPQIFHFIGHGKNVGYSYLELTDKNEQKAPQEWTVQDIAIHLRHWKPRLAFVNACRTSSTAGQEHSWDIASAFAALDVPAVIGMQADIQGVAAAAFSGKFYESLVDNLPIDCSLAEARAAVSDNDNVTIKRRDWALATLYLQQLPEQILDMKPVIDKTTVNKFKLDSELKKTSDFVGRLKLRRKLWYGVDQVTDRDEEFSSLCIVVGGESIGKTALVQASMKVCALRNRKVSYVDIGLETKNFVEILKIIREGDPNSSRIICAPLPQEPFADFDKKYGALIEQPDAAITLAADNNLCEHFFNAYKDALITISAAEPLIIVLDHLKVEWNQFNNILVEKLINPIAQNLVGNCRMILVCTTDEFKNSLKQELKDAACVIEVSAWKPEKFVPLARQICLYNNIKLDADKESAIVMFSKIISSDWKPEKLRCLVGLLNP